MRLLIEASNIRAGGGVSHLVALLGAANPQQFGISRVTVCAPIKTLELLPNRSWLTKYRHALLEKGLYTRRKWQRQVLPTLLTSQDMLFVPGGIYHGSFRPFVTMAQNLLPFMPEERRRVGFSYEYLRCVLLEREQTATFKCADGVIFLTSGSQDIIVKRIGFAPNRTAVIPHGADADFFLPPREQIASSAYSEEHPFRFLYVSSIDFYKQQTNVARAIARMRSRNLPVALDIVGPAYGPALQDLKAVIATFPDADRYIKFKSEIPHHDLPRIYADADAFVFASTCETFGIILLEAMAAGLPVACSSRIPMPEIAGSGAVYFDPENVDALEQALIKIFENRHDRESLAAAAFERAKSFSWQRCAEKTFDFLHQASSHPTKLE